MYDYLHSSYLTDIGLLKKNSFEIGIEILFERVIDASHNKKLMYIIILFNGYLISFEDKRVS